MSDKLFTPEEREILLRNKNVLRVGETSITYSPEFKVEAVRAALTGKPPQLIFVDAGFDLDLIGRQIPKRCLGRWRAIFAERGEDGLRDDQRGKKVVERPLARELTVEEQLRRAEAKIRYLEKENEFLKKLDAVERSWLAEHRKSTR